MIIMLNILVFISTVFYLFIATSKLSSLYKLSSSLFSYNPSNLTLASYFILLLFEYCNILLFSLPDYKIKNCKYYIMR